jgi:hypothetical protein
MRFAVYVECEHESGPRCGADAVAAHLCLYLNDLRIDARQGTQEEWSSYTIEGASPKRWEK